MVFDLLLVVLEGANHRLLLGNESDESGNLVGLVSGPLLDHLQIGSVLQIPATELLVQPLDVGVLGCHGCLEDYDLLVVVVDYSGDLVGRTTLELVHLLRELIVEPGHLCLMGILEDFQLLVVLLPVHLHLPPQQVQVSCRLQGVLVVLSALLLLVPQETIVASKQLLELVLNLYLLLPLPFDL